ncbi:hypothetical protein BH23GEM9_BH23GEM9_04590 [soil metagenome]
MILLATESAQPRSSLCDEPSLVAHDPDPPRHSTAAPAAAPLGPWPRPRRPAPAGPHPAATSRNHRRSRGPTASPSSTAAAIPLPRHRSSSTISRPSWAKQPRPIPMTAAYRSGSRTTSAPTSLRHPRPRLRPHPLRRVRRRGPRRLLLQGRRRLPHPAMPAAWSKWPPTSPTTSCHRCPSVNGCFPCRVDPLLRAPRPTPRRRRAPRPGG